VATFSLSAPLLPTPPNVTTPAEFVLRLARESGTYADALKQRVAAIKKDGHGAVFTYADGKSTRVSDIASADALWKTLLAGAVWRDDPIRNASMRLPVHGPDSDATFTNTSEFPLTLVASDPPPRSSPLMSKLYRESGLRTCVNQATVHPETGRRYGLEQGSRANIRTASGAVTVQVLFNPAAMPGTIEANSDSGAKCAPASIRRI
jgi:anaerobic selenocysteine-containing dehydrogenase